MTYGYEVHGRHDKMLNASKRMINFAQENVLPGALLVNYLPCPGRHLVGATLFLVVASLFSVFNIGRGEGGGGKLSDYTFTVYRYSRKVAIGFLSRVLQRLMFVLSSHVNQFSCSFVPRDKKARELILADTVAR